MAATHRPRLMTERIQLPLSPADSGMLAAIATRRGLPRTVTLRALIRDEHSRTAREGEENDR